MVGDDIPIIWIVWIVVTALEGTSESPRGLAATTSHGGLLRNGLNKFQNRPFLTWENHEKANCLVVSMDWFCWENLHETIDFPSKYGVFQKVTKKEHSITWLYEIQKDQTACSCFKQGSVSHTSTKHPMRLHCIATNSWGQVPSEFSRANAAAEAVKQIQKGKENPWGQRVVPQQKPRSGT